MKPIFEQDLQGLILQSLQIWRQPILRTPLVISLGAIAGALSRYYLGGWVTDKLGSTFPYGTLVVNVTGCFAMGAFAALALQQPGISPELRLLIAVGFLGSYTTFSTYALDTSALLLTGRWQSALAYWAGSTGLGLISLIAASWCVQWLRH